MAYLARRIRKLITDLESGNTKMLPNVGKELIPELEKVRYLENGDVDLATCSPRLRAVARAYYLAAEHIDEDNTTADRQASRLGCDSVTSLNASLFELYEEVFEAGTGVPPERFTRGDDDFNAAMLRLKDRFLSDRRFAGRTAKKLEEATKRLQVHYANSGNIRLNAAARTGGLKLVLGGAQGFSSASLHAARSMLLYCDSLLIPDPVHRWFEVEPVHEKFPAISMLREIFHLSKLKPLAQAHLPGPPIIIFPSWEKRMERDDLQAKDGIELIALDVFSWVLNGRFEDIKEVIEFARRQPELFLSSVAKKDAFIPMGKEIEGELSARIGQQRAEIEAVRSPSFANSARSMTDSEIVWLTIMERLGPQFHIMDNADSLGASPLFALPVHWHYFRICQQSRSAAMKSAGTLSKGTVRLVEQLAAQKSSWLGNVSTEDLLRLRHEGVNRDFRERLKVLTDRLDEDSFDDLDKALAEVSVELKHLLVEHDRESKKIDEEFRNRHGKTLASLLLTVGASFIPWIPPLAPAIATGAAIKLAHDGIDEVARRGQVRKSLLGVLAAAHRKKGQSGGG